MRLTDTQRHNRIFLLIQFGVLLGGGIYFLAVDPNLLKLMLVVPPIIASAVCIVVFGVYRIRLAWLTATLLTVSLDIAVFWQRLGDWHHQRFWSSLMLFFAFSAAIFMYTFLYLSLLVRKVERMKSPKVEVIDYKGRN